MDMKPANQMNPKSRMKTTVNKGSPGPEKKADMSGAMNGKPSGGLKGAMAELKSQNHEMGHLRHEPLAGLKPRGGDSNS